MTGQTGSGQARLTLGGSINDVHGIGMQTPLSGSHLGPHCKRITRSVQQGRLQRSSLFLVHSLQRRLLLLQPRIRTEAFDDELKYVLTKLGSPFKGLGRTGVNDELFDFDSCCIDAGCNNKLPDDGDHKQH